MKRLLITNGKLVLRDSIVDGGLLCENGIISDVGYIGDTPDDTELVDADGCYVLPGFIEPHAHGGGGYDFIDNTETAFDEIFKLHRAHGVTQLCPTLCACGEESMFEFLSLASRLSDRTSFAGVHLEGPFLSPAMSGAQNRSRLLLPDERIIERLEYYKDIIARITAAPELNGVDTLARRMKCAGVSMSIGHSNADAETARRALRLGFDSVTHLFCSTSGRTKYGGFVRGGIIEAALLDDDCYIELIGDGHHVSPESFRLALKCRGADKICVVSDAMRAAFEVVKPDSTDCRENAVSSGRHGCENTVAAPNAYPNLNTVSNAYSNLNTVSNAHPSFNAAPNACPNLNNAPNACPNLNAAPNAHPNLNNAPNAYSNLNTTSTGESYLGAILPENRVILEDGVAKLPDRTSFAGSLAVGDSMVESLCQNYGLDLVTVSRMMSATPAALLGLTGRGQLRAGYHADIVLLDKDYRTNAVFIDGKRVV